MYTIHLNSVKYLLIKKGFIISIRLVAEFWYIGEVNFIFFIFPFVYHLGGQNMRNIFHQNHIEDYFNTKRSIFRMRKQETS